MYTGATEKDSFCRNCRILQAAATAALHEGREGPARQDELYTNLDILFIPCGTSCARGTRAGLSRSAEPSSRTLQSVWAADLQLRETCNKLSQSVRRAHELD